jgi:uncharacterized RDD family membrane protein YckC
MNQDCDGQTSSHNFADFASRLKATLADSLIYLIAILIMVPILNKLALLAKVPLLSGVLVITMLLCFEAAQVAIWGRTLGHRMFGLRVVNSRGKNPNFAQAMLRWVVKVILGVLAFITMMAGNGKTVHDIITSTRVIYA